MSFCIFIGPSVQGHALDHNAGCAAGPVQAAPMPAATGVPGERAAYRRTHGARVGMDLIRGVLMRVQNGHGSVAVG